MAIRGTSAGGLTALAALVRSRVFAGAVAWYGVTDLAALAADTHDFESRYLDGLVGPLPGGGRRRTGTGRPLHHAADLVGRVLLLQGADDPIVPLDQAERFAAGLAGRRGRVRTAGVPGRAPRLPGRGHDRGGPRCRARLLPGAVRPRGRPMTDACPGAGAWRSAVAWLRASPPTSRDALLYGASALFAGVTAGHEHPALPGVGPAGRRALRGGSGWMVVVARRRAAAARSGPDGAVVNGRAWRAARLVAFLIVLLGATVVPLALEVVWASEGNAALHVQPEVLVVERAGVRAAHGQDPYRVVDRNGHILIRQNADPGLRALLPLPARHGGLRVLQREQGRGPPDRRPHPVPGVHRDRRLVALSRIRPPTDARVRALQVADRAAHRRAPPGHGGRRHAGGGPDAARTGGPAAPATGPRRPGPRARPAPSSSPPGRWCVLALFAATDRQRRRAVGRYAWPWPVLVVPVVLPVALHNPSAFIDNVVRFPLGLAGVASPAASALPGHILVSPGPGCPPALRVVAGRAGPGLPGPLPGAAPAAGRRRRGPGHRLGDADRHPARPGHPCRLPALPDQPVRVGVDVPRLGRPRRRRGRSDRRRLGRRSVAVGGLEHLDRVRRWTRSAWWGRPTTPTSQ